MLMHPSHGAHQRSEQQDPTPARPYVYELFAVLVHSGSALGGHYYAYIKVLDDPDGEPRWLKFNDSTVTTVTTATVAADGSVFFSRVFQTRINCAPHEEIQLVKTDRCIATIIYLCTGGSHFHSPSHGCLQSIDVGLHCNFVGSLPPADSAGSAATRRTNPRRPPRPTC